MKKPIYKAVIKFKSRLTVTVESFDKNIKVEKINNYDIYITMCNHKMKLTYPIIKEK